MNIEEVAKQVVDAAYTVHVELGPGLLESTYEACLEHELRERGLNVQRQLEQPVHYKGITINAGYRLDLLVEEGVVVELKSVEQLLPIHQAQVLTYLKLSGKELGFLINFNVPLLKQGLRRLIQSSTK
ncbi:GxxExxY protein [Haloferula sp. A504]|uniref:GxxExxY protein n=1 Tax=Haloferula sp. A504 TaxID=3373601 RepID=UPI0031C6F065|nr:GxxExxY protein [Verrucomicrobiaceae bacterium E54]